MTVKTVVGVTRDVAPKASRRKQQRGAAAPNSPRNVEAEAKQKRAWDLRVAGATFPDIARELGIEGTTPERRAAEMVETWRVKVRTVDLGDVTRERELMAARLDRMLLDLWGARTTRVEDGVDADQKPRYRTEVDGSVIDRIVRVMDRQAKLLGLDAADLRDDRRLELLAEQAESIARALDETLVELGVTEEVRSGGRRLLASKLRIIEGESIRISERAG